MYLELLPPISFLNSQNNASNSEPENYFLNEKGEFKRVSASDLGAGSVNATFDEDAIRALPLKESFHMNLPQGESENIENDDTLWMAIAKIWKKATQSFTLTPKGFDFVNAYTIVEADDDQKTLLVTGGKVTLPQNPKNGFLITIKSKSPSSVEVDAGVGVFIDNYEDKITLKNKYASVRLVKGSERWHIVHKHGEIE